MEIISEIKEILAGGYNMYFAFAIFGSVILFIQFMFAIFGFGGFDHDCDIHGGDSHLDLGDHADTGLIDFQIFSIRTIVAFITFFGWGGVAAWKGGLRSWQCFLPALLCGIFMMLVTAALVYFMLKMQHSGNIVPEEMIGAKGTVYLRIPGGNEIGKVNVDVKGTRQELVALADSEIPRGELIEVLEYVGGTKYRVKKI